MRGNRRGRASLTMAWAAPPEKKRTSSSYYRRLYGKTLKELAQVYQVSVSTIFRWLHHGWKPKPPSDS